MADPEQIRGPGAITYAETITYLKGWHTWSCSEGCSVLLV